MVKQVKDKYNRIKISLLILKKSNNLILIQLLFRKMVIIWSLKTKSQLTLLENLQLNWSSKSSDSTFI